MAKYRATDALELVHSDLCGLITPATNYGRRCFLLLVDDCSRYMWLQLLTSKDKAVDAIKKFQARAEVEFRKKLRVLRIDRDGEFTLVEFATYCMDQGVAQHHTVLYSPQQNARGGAAEQEGGWHGSIHDEGQEHADKVLG